MAVCSLDQTSCVRCSTTPTPTCSGSLWVRQRKPRRCPAQRPTCRSFTRLTQNNCQRNWLAWSGRQGRDGQSFQRSRHDSDGLWPLIAWRGEAHLAWLRCFHSESDPINAGSGDSSNKEINSSECPSPSRKYSWAEGIQPITDGSVVSSPEKFCVLMPAAPSRSPAASSSASGTCNAT